MTLSEVFFRDSAGSVLGPVPLRNVEVLYCTEIIDERTPVSDDGDLFSALGNWADLLAQVKAARETITSGGNPWPAAPVPVAAPEAARSPAPAVQSDEKPLRRLFALAAQKATGTVRIERDVGPLEISLSDGKITAVSCTWPELGLARFLVEQKIAEPMQIAEADRRAPSMGGDLGAALISLGAVQPHVYVETLVRWARSVLLGALNRPEAPFHFTAGPVPPAAVPLGFERLKIFSELVGGLPGELFETTLADKHRMPLIPAAVEGADIEELKLDPKAFRVAKSIDGTKNLGEILEASQGKDDLRAAALRAVYLTSEVGLIVFGHDDYAIREEREIRRLQDLLREASGKNYFELFGLDEKSTDAEADTRYKDFAKKFHPDTLRKDASPELINATNELFNLYRTTFDFVRSQAQREDYASRLNAGYDPTASEQEIVRNVLNAEIEFKKAEALFKMRRYPEAQETLERALSAKPDDVEAKVYLRYVVFMNSPRDEQSALLAIRDLGNMLRGNGNLVCVNLFLARLNKQVDQVDEAFKFFRRVLDLEPKNHEAASEIRLAEMRAEKKKKKKWL